MCGIAREKTKQTEQTKPPEYVILPDWIGIWPSNQKMRNWVVISDIPIHSKANWPLQNFFCSYNVRKSCQVQMKYTEAI